MKTFKDAEGREWQIAINIDAIKRVRAALDGFDLLALTDGNVIQELIGDPVKLVDTIFVLCQDQATARGCSDAEFGRSMGGDALDLATTALLEEFVDFFPSRKRQPMIQALAKLKQIEAKQVEVALKMVNDPAIDEAIDRAMNLRLGGQSSIATPLSSAELTTAA